MLFGLTNAPATFQALMNQVFRPYLHKFLLVFFDDILVYNKDALAHLEYLTLVFQLLRQHSLFDNRKKCQFAKDRIEYLDHWVSAKGVEADQEKIRAMLEWPIPKNVRITRVLGFNWLLLTFCGKLWCYRHSPNSVDKEKKFPLDRRSDQSI